QYDAQLPPGARFQDLPSGTDLVMKDVTAIPDEPYSPPMSSFSYRLFYYYTGNFSAQDFWKGAGKSWSQKVDRFAAPSDAITRVVTGMVAPGDTDDQKLKKIYEAAMTVDNTAFSRERSETENKAEGVQIKTEADIWAQKRGTPTEITRLFIAMARAAGLKASAMIVTERDQRVLNANYLHWDQLTDEIAIVTVGGKEIYFDPGERYCDYGKLHWEHTQILGIRQTDNGTEAVLTPAAEYKDSVVDRRATLELGPDGKLQGTITLSMTGVEALRWRQVGLRNDEEETKKRIEEELQALVPDGARVKTTGLTGLTDESQPLVATLEVSGSMGTATGKRILLPGSFFETNARPLFPEGRRENPVDLHYPYAVRDQVKVALAPGLTVDTLPANAQIPFPKSADYIAKYGGSGSVYQQARLMALGKTVYSKDEYPELRDFLQKASAQDQQQVVLDRTPVAASAAGGSGANQ
ncbi:MAG: transglutaminase, partial [Acidobacteriaceae bacterium]